MRFYSILAAAVLIFSPAFGQRKQANPLEQLPQNIEVLTNFGERADISPDNQRVAFMAKSFGDAFVIDLKTRAIRCLTCNVPGAAFLRVMHLHTGDYILIGPDHFEDIRTSRARDNELWFLSQKPGSKPLKLGQKMSEGAAISKTSMKIGFSIGHAQDPAIPEGATRLFVANVDAYGEKPGLKNLEMVYDSKGPECYLEAQDFFDKDRKMTFSCYEPAGEIERLDHGPRHPEGCRTSRARSASTTRSKGFSLMRLHTCIESDHQSRVFGDGPSFRNIDIWKLRMDGTGKSFTRLTTFNDHEGWKASNPVVATNGRFMAFQVGRTADEAGVGYGILLYHFQPVPKKDESRSTK